jgi:hypothetical protein
MALDSSSPGSAAHSWLRASIVLPAGLVVVALAYLGWVFLSRAQQDRRIEEQAAAAKHAQDQQVFQNLGGNRFDILNFYAYPATIRLGDESDICYGVSNAKSVALEPRGKDPVWPANSRCVKAAPRKTTTYTLTATDAAGHTKTASVTVAVQ